MKKSVKLLILLVVLAVLILAYVLVASLSKQPEQPGDDTDEPTAFPVLSVDKTTLTGITYNVGETVYSFCTKEDMSGWEYEDDPELPLSNTPFLYMLAAVNELTSEICLDGVSEEKMLTAYGIGADGSLIVRLVDSVNGEQVLRFGNANAYNGKIYVATDGAPGKVYMVGTDVADVFAKTPDAMVVDDTLPTVSESKFRSVRLLSANGSLTVTRRIGAGEDGADEWTRQDEETEAEGLTAEAGEEILQAITSMKLSGAVSFHEADRVRYGVENAGRAVLTIGYMYTREVKDEETGAVASLDTEAHYDLYLGDMTAEGEIYVRLPEGKGIYRVTLPETLQEFFN